MAKAVKPLSDLVIKAAKAKDKIYGLSDGNNLQVRISPHGTKSWVFTYQRPITRKRASITFGIYPALSLKLARTKAIDAQSLLANNVDPSEHRKEEDRIKLNAINNTLEKVTLNWLNVKSSEVSSSHAHDIKRSFELHVFPDLGETPLDKITAPIAIATLKPLEKLGSLEQVKRVSQRLNEVMNYAVNTGIIDHNKLHGIRQAFKTPVSTNMPTIAPDLLPKLIKTVNECNSTLMIRNLIKWQLHTMVRPSESAKTEWSEIDLDNKVWHIPAERMKKRKPHSVPLSDVAIELLNQMKEITGNRQHVFVGTKDKLTHIHVESANRALKRMGYDKKLVAHGLRSLASTTLNEYGFQPDLIESALAHTDPNQVRSAYNRTDYLERRRIMMQWWSNHINGNTQESSIVDMAQGLQKVKVA